MRERARARRAAAPGGYVGPVEARRRRNREYVAATQVVLRQLGLYRGPIDGVWGPRTQAAYDQYVRIYRNERPFKFETLAEARRYEREYREAVARRAREVQQRYERLRRDLSRMVSAGELSTLDRAIALNEFLARQSGFGGQFATAARRARENLRALEQLRQQRDVQREQLAARERARNSLPGKVLGGVGRAAGAVWNSWAVRNIRRGASSLVPLARETGLISAGKFVLRAVEFPHELISRAYYANQLIENQKTREGRRFFFGDMAEIADEVQSALGALGFRDFLPDEDRRALEATDTPEEREELRRRGLLESFGERQARLWELRWRALSARFRGDRKALAEIRRQVESGDFRRVGGSKAATWPARLWDLTYTLLADPLIAAGPALRAPTALKSTRAVERIRKYAPRAVDNLLTQTARLAEQAAARNPNAIVGDVAWFQRLAPAMRGRSSLQELAAVVTANDLGTVERFLFNRFARQNRQTRREAVDLIRRIRVEGLNESTRRAILDLALGRMWRPSLRLPAVAADTLATAAAKSDLSMPLAQVAMQAVPPLQRHWKAQALATLAARRARPRPSYIGRAITAPDVGELLKRYGVRDAEEIAAARKAFKQLQSKQYAGQVRGLVKRIQQMPDSPLRDMLAQHVAKVTAEVDAALAARLAKMDKRAKRYARMSLAKLDEEIARVQRRLRQRALSPSRREQLAKRLAKYEAEAEQLRKDIAKYQKVLRRTNIRRETRKAREEALADAEKQLAKVEEQITQARERLAGGLTAPREAILRAKLKALRDARRFKTLQFAHPAIKRLRKVQKDVIGFENVKPITYEHAVYNLMSELRDYGYMIGAPPPQRASLATRIGRALSRTFEDVPKAAINLHNVVERAVVMRDWARAMGASALDADYVYARMSAPMPADEALKVAEDIQWSLIAQYMRNRGLTPPEVENGIAYIRASMKSFLREQQHWSAIADDLSRKHKPRFDKVYDVHGARDPVVLGQYQYILPLINPSDVAKYVTHEKIRDWGLAGDVLRAMDTIVRTGGYWYRAGPHAFFKFAVLTLAPIRYILRVPVIEESARSYMAHGVWGLVRLRGRHVRRLNHAFLDDTRGERWATGWEHIGLENVPMHFAHLWLTRVAGHGVIKQGEPGFVENLWHILQFQVRPEDDMLHKLLMPHLYNEAGLVHARESAIELLTTTHRGRTYFEKARQLNKEYVDPAKLVDSVITWLRQVMPTDDVVQYRLAGRFSMKTLRAHPEWWPSQVWGDKYERLWSVGTPAQTFERWKAAVARGVLQAPSAKLQREPFYWYEFNKEYDALTAAGFTPQAAREMADDYAIKRTNDVLFDATVRSRFAARFDVLFPFQQAREEVLRVWLHLSRERPERAARLLRFIATAFNNGANNGVFVEDQYGNWTMRVPLSPGASRALGNWLPQWVPFREVLRNQPDIYYSYQLRNLLFVNDVWGIVPRPGGPWWTVLGNYAFAAHPEWFASKRLQKLFGIEYLTPLFLRPELTRLWIAATGLTFVPWEPLASLGLGTTGEPYTERVRDKMVGEIGAELYRQWILAGAKPEDEPTPEDIANAVRAYLWFHGMLGMVWPAATVPRSVGRDEFEALLETRDERGRLVYVREDGSLNIERLLYVHPEMVGFIQARSKDVVRERYTDDEGNVDIDRLIRENPEYWKRWRARGSPYESGPEAITNRIYAARDYLSPEEWSQAIKESMRNSEAWDEFNNIINSGGMSWEILRDLEAWKAKYSDRDEAWGESLRNYRAKLEYFALRNRGALDEDIKRWQYRFDISESKRREFEAEWLKSGPWATGRDLWTEARPTGMLITQWQERNPHGLSLIEYAKKHFSPAEQYNVFTRMLGEVTDVEDFNAFYSARGETASKYADVLFQKGEAARLNKIMDESKNWWGRRLQQAGAAIREKGALIDAIERQQQAILDRINKLKQGGYNPEIGRLWRLYYQLKDRRNRLYAEIRGIQNAMYDRYPDLQNDFRGAQAEMRYLRALAKYGPEKLRELGLDKLGIPALPESQERKWRQMPRHIQQDYLDDLIERLSLPAGRWETEEGKSRIRWEYLTEWQKDLLAEHLSPSQYRHLKRLSQVESAKEEAMRSRGRRGRYRRWGFRRWRWHIGGLGLGEGFGELAFALEMFKQYNRRPPGMQPPTRELEEYKRLGDNAVLKAEYLRKHPRLQRWLALGPMANMPPAVAEIVHNIMVKYGRWEDDREALSWDELSEVAFARTMLARYNRRRGDAPEAWERWLRMPTGPEKARYLREHPEIEEWLQTGPMANMPDNLREVVRDIMLRYGLWTQRTDPLSVLIQQYHETPSYAKQAFLERHPEILAYWRALRTGEERRLFDLAQTYFALPSSEEKRAFLEAYPELHEYFIEERRRNYRNFLNRVAYYLGSAPGLAEEYLENQTRYIRELVDKYGQRLLVPDSVLNVSITRPREWLDIWRVRE